jgi:hypothetical protein
MVEFDEQKRREEEEARLKQNVPDDDGFVLVQRVSRRGVNRAGDITAVAAAPGTVAPKKPTVMVNFYAFQEKAEKLKGPS